MTYPHRDGCGGVAGGTSPAPYPKLAVSLTHDVLCVLSMDTWWNFGHELKKKRYWPFLAKCTGWGFFILSRYILAILGENVPTGGFSFSAGTFWPFWAKMYQLGFFILSLYILAILGEMYQLGFLYSQPVPFGHFGRTFLTQARCEHWQRAQHMY